MKKLLLVGPVVVLLVCGAFLSAGALSIQASAIHRATQKTTIAGITWGTAVDKQGHVFVVLRELHQILKLSHRGRLLARWKVSADPSTSQAPDLAGIAVGPTGNVYVTDALNYRILTLSPSGKVVRVIHTAHFHHPVRFGPMGLAIDSAGNIYTADFDYSAIEKYSASGRLLASYGKNLDGPDDVALDRQDNIYVNDHRNNRIVKLSPRGHQLRVFGPSLPGPYLSFNQPEGVAVDLQGNIYVAHDELVKLSPSGNPVAHWRPPGNFAPNGDMGFDAQGNIYATILEGPPPVSRVVKLSPSLQLLATWK